MELDISKIFLSDHAIDRAYERMQLDSWKKEKVCKHVKSLLKRAKYIGRIAPTDDGTDSEMFVKGSFSFLLNTNLTTVKTIIKTDRLQYNPVQEKVKCLYEKEFRKLDRKEKARLNKLELYQYEVAAEISKHQLHIYKTKSISVKLACQGRIKALEQSLKELEIEINKVKNQKRQIAYALAQVID
jgi:hypothetical protein